MLRKAQGRHGDYEEEGKGAGPRLRREPALCGSVLESVGEHRIALRQGLQLVGTDIRAIATHGIACGQIDGAQEGAGALIAEQPAARIVAATAMAPLPLMTCLALKDEPSEKKQSPAQEHAVIAGPIYTAQRLADRGER